MKILYFHQHFSTPSGATGTRSYEFAKMLLKHGHEVTVVCGNYWIADTGLRGEFKNNIRQGIVDGIIVKEIDLTYSNRDSFFTRAIKFLQFSWMGIKIVIKNDYDICFASSTPLTAGIPAIIAKIFFKKPFIFEVRDLWPELPIAMGVIKNKIIIKLLEFLEETLYNLSSACIGLSPGIVEGIKKKVPNKNVIMIPNGCDFELISKSFTDSSGKDRIFKAVFTGAHGYANNLNTVLDVAKVLLRRNENKIIIEFIGDGALKDILKKRKEEENLVNCRFLDPKPKKVLFKYLHKEANIGLMILDNIPAFYYGTSPNKFFDYIALGLPVINNYPGWVSDMIRENNCGIPVEANNPEAFADALVSLKNDNQLLSTMGNNAKTLAKKHFDRQKLSKKFVKFIESNFCI